MHIMSNDLYDLMAQALEEAEKGFAVGEVPVGALLIGRDGTILSRAYNQPLSLKDPTAHAEILALREGALYYNNYRMNDTTLVSTVEPCPMCMGAALHARISRLIFGAYDVKWGAAGSLFDLAADKRLNHRIEVVSGIMEKECRELLQEFFRIQRNKKNGLMS